MYVIHTICSAEVRGKPSSALQSAIENLHYTTRNFVERILSNSASNLCQVYTVCMMNNEERYYIMQIVKLHILPSLSLTIIDAEDV